MQHRSSYTTALLALAVLVVAPLSHALAQGQSVDVASHDTRFQAPAGWHIDESIDASGLLTMELYHPSGGGVVVVASAVITPADREYWSSPGNVLLEDVWTGFRPEVPGAQEQQRYEAEVAGLPAYVLDYASPQVAGTIVVFVGPAAAFTLISAGDAPTLPEVQGALELIASSFQPHSVAQSATPPQPPETPDSPDGQPNPLDPPGNVNPLDPAGAEPANPLDAAPPSNPLDGAGGGAANPLDAAPPAAADPYLGRFVDPDVTLVLEGTGGAYTGEMLIMGAPFPVNATLVDGRLDGTFGSGDQRFAFTAELSGDILMLESDGARFVLERRP